jgi:hypothetical protein
VSGTVTLAAGAYGHDRWKAGASGCTYTFATSDNVTTITISAGSLIQVVEGLNLYTNTYTLSWTGTAQGKIGAGSYAASGVTGSVTGGSNLNIEFNTGTLSLVQLEAGSVASPFERRDYGRELAMCQRYYWKNTAGSIYTTFGAGLFHTTTGCSINIQYPVRMRASPTAAYGGNVNAYDNAFYNLTSISSSYLGTDSGLLQFVTSGATQYRPCLLIANNDATANINFSAEL